MKQKLGIIKYLIIAIVCFLVFMLCPSPKDQTTLPRSYNEIIQSGELRVATEYNSISFFIDDDTLSGFNYELIEKFAAAQGLRSKFIPLMSFDDRMKALATGTVDIIASDIPVTSTLKDSLLLSTPLLLGKYVLVQRKAEADSDSVFIRSQLDLGKRSLYVVKGSPVIMRIRNLESEIGDTIYVNEIEKYGPEQLIALVAHGDIDYAVCEETLAKTSIQSFPQIDIDTDISFNQFQSWAVSKQSQTLLDSLNLWLNKHTNTREYKELLKKYYQVSK